MEINDRRQASSRPISWRRQDLCPTLGQSADSHVNANCRRTARPARMNHTLLASLVKERPRSSSSAAARIIVNPKGQTCVVKTYFWYIFVTCCMACSCGGHHPDAPQVTTLFQNCVAHEQGTPAAGHALNLSLRASRSLGHPAGSEARTTTRWPHSGQRSGEARRS